MKNLNLLFNLFLFPFLFLMHFTLSQGQDKHSHLERVNYLKLFFTFLLIFQFPTILLATAETEPNESCAAANLLLDTATSTDSGYINGTIDDNSDDDYFKIILTQRAELRLDKNDRNNKKTRAKVLESDCSTSLGSTNSKDKTNWKFLLDAGTYYIHFYRSNKDNAQYKIRAKMNRVADFVVSKSVDNATPSVGDTITYTISTTNNGPSGSKVHITDSLPAGLTFVSENKSGCNQSGNGLECKKWLDSGATFEVDLEARVDNGASGLITNTVNVEKDTTNGNGDKTFESDLTNNSSHSDITVSALPVVTNADDLCYDSVTTSGICSGIVSAFCTITTPIKNLSSDNLTNVTAVLGTSSLFSAFSDCGVDGSSGNCRDASGLGMMGFSAFNGGVAYDLPGYTANQDHSAYNSALFSFLDSPYDWVATYEKNGKLYKGVVSACAVVTPPPGDERIPNITTTDNNATCGTFEDGLQTRANHSKVDFSGGSGKLFNNPDAGLNTYSTPVNDGSGNDITCNDNLDGTTDQSCSANGAGAMSIAPFTMLYPATYSFVSPFDTSSGDTIVVGKTSWGDDYNSGDPLEDFIYKEVSAHGSVSPNHLNFKVTNLLKLGTLSTQVGNEVTFTSKTGDTFELQLKNVTTSTNNTFTANTNIKNIKMDTVTFGNDATVSLKAEQTIKINTLTTSHTTTLTLEAQYVNINSFTDSSGLGQANTITIKADYIDIDSLNLGDVTTLNIVPYTAGKKVVVRMNTFHTGSKNVINFKEGDYYIKTLDTQGSGNGYQWNMDAGNRVNLFLEDDYTTDSEIAINADTTGGSNLCLDSHSALDLFIFTKGNLTVKNDSRLVATIYSEQDVALNSSSYVKGAISANDSITLGNETEVCYDQNIDAGGFGECNANATYGCSKPHAFELRKNLVTTGDLIAIGNSNICADYDKNGICDTNQKKRNDTSNIIEVNSTSSTAVSSEPSSLHNTSAANLSLPTGATVVWAGLYWQGEVWDINMDHKSRVGGSGIAIENGADGQARKALADKIKFKVPNGNYEDLTADEHYYFFVRQNSNDKSDYKGIQKRYEEHYQGFKDVTDLVANAGEGDYWVANIQATLGKLWYPGVEASWSLQVIYNDPNGAPRSISITDGYLGLYGNGNAGDQYATAINTLNENHECKTGGANTGAYNNEVSFDVGGFLTPSDPGFQTDMSLFLTEADPDGQRPEEQLTITKKDGSISKIDGPGAWNYEITQKDGVTNNDARTPNYIYPIGTTIKNYHKTDILSPEQTSTKVTFQTGSDRLMLGVVGFATDLRKPKLCYDYSYSQGNTILTEDNNGSEVPHLKASVSTASPIDVQLYIKNMENSDIVAKGMKMSVLDINTSQATYISGTTEISNPGSSIVNQVPESEIDSSDAYIKNIQLGNLDSLQYFYTYYQLDPTRFDINMPIYARVDYNITVPIDNGTITLPYQVYLNSDIPLCGGGTNTYEPTYGVFDVVHNDYYNSSHQYYNIPTQVTSREGNFKVIALDKTNQDTLHNVSTVVAVELIAAEGFHITDAQCQDTRNSISDRVWVTFDNNVSSVMFNKAAIQTAITRGMTSLTNSSDFYKNARQNAAFRVSYNLTNDGSDSLVKTELQNNGNYKILNFTKLVQNISNCSSPVEHPSNPSQTTNKVSVACGNAGNNGISARQLRICNECVYGYNTKFVCSRDNFSIRPEALSVKVYDDNQSTQPKLEIDNTISDVVAPSSHILNLAAGYDYDIEVNATNYLNHNAAPGYTKTIDPSVDTAMYKWEPRNSHIITGCNDTNNSNLNLTFVDGQASSRKKLSQIGDYRLHVEDKTWTSVDSNPLYMTHHTGAHFTQTPDCITNSDITQVINASAGSSTPLIGCDINSTHNNSFNTLKYRDYNITFHPYTFDVSHIVPSIGLNNAAITGTSYVYMADLSQPQDENMSYHLNGTISAVGKDNVVLSNFVNNCYGENLNIDLNKSATTLPVAYQYKFHTYEANSTEIGTSNVVDLNNTNAPIVIGTPSFSKDLTGSANTRLNLNYDRTNDNAMNPEAITFISYKVNCSTQANCTYSANQNNNEIPQGVINLNQTVKHYYGRTNAPRQRFTGNTGTAFIYYQIYCSGGSCHKSLLPNGADSNSTDDPRWFINKEHTNATEGVSGNVTQKNSAYITEDNVPNGYPKTSATLTYDAQRGYPYKGTMENNASSWLIYNKYNAGADTNEFEVEFINDNSDWAGQHETNTSTTKNASDTTNRRSMW